MSSNRFLGIGLVALVFMGGCESTPTVTRTGDVKDILIGDNPSAAEVSVNPGDEVRWINQRTAPVRIVFLDPVNDRLSCKNNIGGWMTPNDTIKLGTNETASACFRNVGLVRYTVRMNSALSTGEINVPGVITIGGKQGDAAAQTREQGKGRTNGQASYGFPEPADSQSSGKISAPPSSTSTTTTTTTPAK
jgi:plastocyanin